MIKVPKYKPIQTIKGTHGIALTQERTTIAHRLADLKNKTRFQHIEEKLGEQLWKGIFSYNDICNLEEDPLPCTELVEYEIILNSGKIVNIKSYRPPECHKNEISTQMDDLLKKEVIRHSKSPITLQFG